MLCLLNSVGLTCMLSFSRSLTSVTYWNPWPLSISCVLARALSCSIKSLLAASVSWYTYTCILDKSHLYIDICTNSYYRIFPVPSLSLSVILDSKLGQMSHFLWLCVEKQCLQRLFCLCLLLLYKGWRKWFVKSERIVRLFFFLAYLILWLSFYAQCVVLLEPFLSNNFWLKLNEPMF